MPAPKHEYRLVEIPKAWSSSEAASFFAQMDDLSGRMFEDLRGASAAELAWQPAPGMNTIGMLLAHCAIVEVFWLMIATGTYARPALERVLGIGEDDDGMPLAAGGRPPRALRGRSLAWYRKLHDRARAYAKRTAKTMRNADMKRTVTRTRLNGVRSTTNVRWILYHVLEHQGGHYGQMLLLRHLKRDGKGAPEVSGDTITRLAPPAGYASTHVATCVAGVDELRERLLATVRGLTPAQLEWQPRPGANTIGMLLAHVAVAETHLAQVGLLGERDGHVHDVIGITVEDEGLPLAPGAPPSPALAGKDVAFYESLLAKAGAHTRAAAAGIRDDQLDADIVRPPRPDGTRRIFTRRWVLFHMLEHAAGHLGQVLALKRDLPA